MVPEFLPYFIVGPLCGLAAHAALTILCLVFSIIYSHYRPLRILCFFYLLISFVFLGWVIWGLQKSPESVLWGHRILYAALALLPVSWFWFFSGLLNERPSLQIWIITGIGVFLAAGALFGKGPIFFGLPLEPDPISFSVGRPQSRVLKVLIQGFCLGACILYSSLIIAKPLRFKQLKRVLIPVILGLLVWFLGGLNDALLASGVIFISKERLLWFASIWLSLFLTTALALHFRSLEREMSRLQKAQIDTLEQSRNEHESLSRAKSKALDHLSHELRTPLSVIQGHIRLLKRKAKAHTSPIVREEVFDSLERNLNRISSIQQETDSIIRSYQELEVTPPPKTIDTFDGAKPRFSNRGKNRRSVSTLSIPRALARGVEWVDLKATLPMETISLYPFVERILNKVKQNAAHRDLCIQLDGSKDLYLNMDPGVLEDILIGLLRNSIENTPDEGLIRVVLEQKGQYVQLKVQDFGIGITMESQRHLFSGLFHTVDTELYASKEPYDFGAGGKGLNLLKLRVYGQRLGFDISVGSQRCLHLPRESDLCHGKISSCEFCKKLEDCLSSGGSTFCVTFPLSK